MRVFQRSVPPVTTEAFPLTPAENAEAQRGRFSDRFLRHFFLPRPPSSPNSGRVCVLAYPAGEGSATILRSMLPKSFGVRWLSASSSQ